MTITNRYLAKQGEDDTNHTNLDSYEDPLMIEFEGYISPKIQPKEDKKTKSSFTFSSHEVT